MRNKTSYILSVILLLTGYPSLSQKQDDATILSGRALFQTHCGACHSVHKEIVGPQLASITKKRSEEWLVRFIQNSQLVIAANDPYAVFLFEGYHHQVMPSFRQLGIMEIKNILTYLEAESGTPTADISSSMAVDQLSNPSVFHGQSIFQTQCAACHFLDHEGSYGPALGSVTKRHPERWLRSFIRNSQKVIAGGDEYAIQLYNRFDHREMVPMEFLREDEISDVLRYIEYQSSSDHATAGAAGRESQFGKKYSEIHTTAIDKPIQGASILRDVVAVLLITGFSIYGTIIIRLFKFLK